ncbi:MAG: PHP domain-containing protein [Candidatus Eremiobacteraeota bacterium]|nr:PHP domain-containing protein [Candidatus Eremiobacteraeota bacterium]
MQSNKALNVDFHLHTTESDGVLEPSALLRTIASVGMDYFSITDHDTLSVYEHHAELLRKFGRRVICGIEVSTNTGDREIHILGYGVRLGPSQLRDVLGDRTQARRLRAERVVEKLCRHGTRISMNDVLRQCTGNMIGRPHIARALVDLGAARDVNDAFDRYLGSGCVAYVPVTTLSPVRAIRAINESGGISVLAHPTRNKAEELVDELAREGLRGIEAYSPSHSAHDAERFRALARRHKLVMTAGTDFHVPTEATPYPGVEVDAGDLVGFLNLLNLSD